jgi:predicted ferric reductase
MTAIDLSADVGLVAVGLVTLNLMLGLLMAVRYSPWRYWPHRRFNYFRIHNWTGYGVLATAVLHPIVLLFSATARFRVVDVIYPAHSPSQPLENTIGAIGLYAIAVVVVTSYFRLALGRPLWKAFHFVIYAAAIAMFWHSIFTNPNLKKTPIDPLDGEKVYIEACCLLIAVFGFLRWRYGPKRAAMRARWNQIAQESRE